MAQTSAQTEAVMQDKQPMRSHGGYEQQAYGKRVATSKSAHPQWTGTGIRVDRDFPMVKADPYAGAAEYENDLSGRVSRG
jgi:hypothetical protein